MNSYKGLIFIKHGRVGTRSEGPDYFLQTKNGDYLLQFKDRHPWQPDYELEFFCRMMVEIEGALNDNMLKVERILQIPDHHIPS
ncbi:hypothetical protein [Chlorobaculum limnaeum]|uniref:hypothetical protein n=1 Tax=Chlorobaculum limnaeum TaxID=274537 RepID=UPI0012EE9FE2|nr:hypothetical protein [Chlorobaculum limnaeum]